MFSHISPGAKEQSSRFESKITFFTLYFFKERSYISIKRPPVEEPRLKGNFVEHQQKALTFSTQKKNRRRLGRPHSTARGLVVNQHVADSKAAKNLTYLKKSILLFPPYMDRGTIFSASNTRAKKVRRQGRNVY